MTGGHLTIGEDVIELGKKYEYIKSDGKHAIIEEGDEKDQPNGFRIWFQVYEIDTNKMYFFHLADEIELKTIDDEMPPLHTFGIKSIMQISENAIRILDFDGNSYEIDKEKNCSFSTKEPKPEIVYFISKMDISFWLASKKQG